MKHIQYSGHFNLHVVVIKIQSATFQQGIFSSLILSLHILLSHFHDMECDRQTFANITICKIHQHCKYIKIKVQSSESLVLKFFEIASCVSVNNIFLTSEPIIVCMKSAYTIYLLPQIYSPLFEFEFQHHIIKLELKMMNVGQRKRWSFGQHSLTEESISPREDSSSSVARMGVVGSHGGQMWDNKWRTLSRPYKTYLPYKPWCLTNCVLIYLDLLAYLASVLHMGIASACFSICKS